MKCNICKKDKSGVFCACGYCQTCISEYGHDKCFEIEQREAKEISK